MFISFDHALLLISTGHSEWLDQALCGMGWLRPFRPRLLFLPSVKSPFLTATPELGAPLSRNSGRHYRHITLLYILIRPEFLFFSNETKERFFLAMLWRTAPSFDDLGQQRLTVRKQLFIWLWKLSLLRIWRHCWCINYHQRISTGVHPTLMRRLYLSLFVIALLTWCKFFFLQSVWLWTSQFSKQTDVHESHCTWNWSFSSLNHNLLILSIVHFCNIEMIIYFKP